MLLPSDVARLVLGKYSGSEAIARANSLLTCGAQPRPSNGSFPSTANLQPCIWASREPLLSPPNEGCSSGYLQEEGLSATSRAFIHESPDLKEYAEHTAGDGAVPACVFVSLSAGLAA